MSEVTRVLDGLQPGEPKAAGELLLLVYEELPCLAARKRANGSVGHTLQSTALADEAWMRLGGSGAPVFQNRAHCFGAAAEAMRRILIERARRRLAAKRREGAQSLDLDEIETPNPRRWTPRATTAVDTRPSCRARRCRKGSRSLSAVVAKPNGARSRWRIWSIGWAGSRKHFRRALPT